MGHEFNIHRSDLALRQNKNLTTAQKLDADTTKKYASKDLDTFVKDVKDKSFISNAPNPEKALWDYEQKKLCNILSGNNGQLATKPQASLQKTNDIRDVVKATKNAKSTILQLKLLDERRTRNPQTIRIKYPAGLLDEFILEYQKIIKWLEDNKFDALTLLGSDNEIHISQHEFEIAIYFLEKMKLISEEK